MQLIEKYTVRYVKQFFSDCKFPMKNLLAFISIALLSSCASQPKPEIIPAQASIEIAPIRKITNTPDLKDYSVLTIRDSNGFAIDYQLTITGNSSFLVSKSNEGLGRLYLQTNECRNQDLSCERKFMITGDLIQNKINLKCFFELRNDVNEGYQGQIIEGLCLDKFNRSFSSSIHQ